MIKKVLVILSAMLMLASCGKKQYDVYLFIGQSNMAGRGDMFPEDTLSAIKHAYILDGNDEIIPAKAPLNIYSTIRKRANMQKINPAYSFARTVTKKSKNDILLVVNARGGSSLDQWLKNAPRDTFSVRRGQDDQEWDGKLMPSFYDEAVDGLSVYPGKYRILYGSSSRDEDLKAIDFQVI